MKETGRVRKSRRRLRKSLVRLRRSEVSAVSDYGRVRKEAVAAKEPGIARTLKHIETEEIEHKREDTKLLRKVE